MSSGIGESRPRPDLSPEGYERRKLRAELRELEAMGFTRAEALDRLLGVSDTDAASDETAPPSGLDPNDVADVALGRKQRELPPSVADVIESLKRRNRW